MNVHVLVIGILKTLIVWRYWTALNFSSLLHVLPFHWYNSRPRSRMKTSEESRLFLLRKTSFTVTPFCSLNEWMNACEYVCVSAEYSYLTSCTVHAASCTHPVAMEVQETWFILSWLHMFKTSVSSARKKQVLKYTHFVWFDHSSEPKTGHPNNIFLPSFHNFNSLEIGLKQVRLLVLDLTMLDWLIIQLGNEGV